MDEEENVVSAEELELLERLVRRPVNLNAASRGELAMIPLLAPADIQLILGARQERGRFESVKNVSEIAGLSLIAAQLIPLIATVEASKMSSVAVRNRWVSSDDDFRILNRALFTMGETSGGMVVERDPLEPTVADFVSAHTSYKTSSGTELILGDHRIESGYGLLFGRTARPMKGGWQVTSVSRAGRGLQSYRSSAEYWGLRGVGVRSERELGRWTASVSSSPVDAVMEENRIISIQRGGLHNTATTTARKHNAREEILVLNWESLSSKKAQLGATAIATAWRNGEAGHQSGGQYLSQYGHVTLKNGSLFWEGATSDRAEPAWIGGLSLSTKAVRSMTLMRAYPRGWHAPRSRPFSEWSGERLNETGMYQAITMRIGKFHIASYGDVYRRTEGEHPTYLPVTGSETALLANYRLSAGNDLLFRWKREEKSLENQITFPDEDFQGGKFREAIRLQADSKPNNAFSFRLRLDRVTATNDGVPNDGRSLSLLGHWDYQQARLSLHWITFSTTDYASRVYVWDLNLPGEMRNRAYSGEGQSIGMRYRLRTATGASVALRLRGLWNKSGDSWTKPDWEGGFQVDIAF